MSALTTLVTLAFGIGACGSTADPRADEAAGEGGATRGNDAAVDVLVPGDGGANPDASLAPALPDAVYPACVSKAQMRSLFPCATTKKCLEDCAACPGTTVNCTGSKRLPSPPQCQINLRDVSRKCVSACESCVFAAAGGPVSIGNDVCGNTCHDAAVDECNCGKCGKVCNPPSPVLLAVATCSAGNCCPPLADGRFTSWSEPCGLCCINSGTCPLDATTKMRNCVAAR